VVEAVERKIEKRTIEVLSGIDESVNTKKPSIGLPHDAQSLDL